MLIIQIIAGCTLILGLALLVRGVRGRKVDDHLYCRRCRFDLSGHSADLTRCTECGNDLAQPKSKRRGRRSRRRHSLAIGLALLVLGGGPFVMTLSGRISQQDFYEYAPLSWLESELRDHDSITLTAINELSRRLQNGVLTNEEINRIVDGLIERQSDPESSWTEAFGDFIESARWSNALSEQKWRRYVEQGFEIHAATQHRIRLDGYVIAKSELLPARTGSGPYDGTYEILGASLDGDPLDWNPFGERHSITVHPRPRQSNEHITWGLIDLDYGVYALRVDYEFTLDFGFTVEKLNKQLVADVEVISEHEPIIDMVSNPRLDRQIKGSIQVERIWIDSRNELRMLLWLNSLPVNVAFDVAVRVNGTEHRIGTACATAERWVSEDLRWKPNDSVLQELEESQSIDVILRSDPQVAEAERIFNVIWEGELTFEAVPVRNRLQDHLIRDG